MPAFDVAAVRRDFPILGTSVRGRPLVYLDNAATSQKPLAVIRRLERYYAQENANVHRGVHLLSEQATAAYESARGTVAAFLGLKDARGCVFVRGATEGINLVAESWGRAHLRAGDEILLTHLEHHANIVPWQVAAERAGARVVVAPVTPRGEVDLPAFRSLLSPRTRIAAFSHVSNALGTVNPAAEMTRLAKAAGAAVLIDGCQAAAHFKVDVPALGCDFYVFSGHKTFGPTGIGVLWGRPELLDAMPPYQSGGDMIRKVDFAGTTFREAPERFEAGTPDISGAIGLAAALDYFMPLQAAAHAHEQALLAAATERLKGVKGLTIVGQAPEKVAVLSFTLEGAHPHDVGTLLDADGVAIRTGHHCCMPLMKSFGLAGTARASFAFYNTLEEVEVLARSLERVRKMTA
ncbi:MAG: SufS family cysteine desulfurase [Opitutales bacterium]|jgi:cysteine desulfurase/selenocysteine lyase